jgi:hypothetical protein
MLLLDLASYCGFKNDRWLWRSATRRILASLSFPPVPKGKYTKRSTGRTCHDTIAHGLLLTMRINQSQRATLLYLQIKGR